MVSAQTFRINGSKNLLTAIGEELINLGYNINIHTKSPNCIATPVSKVSENTKITAFKELYAGISGTGDRTFELPQQYNEALEFAEEQLSDKYWIKTLQKWDVGTYVVALIKDSVGIDGFNTGEIVEISIKGRLSFKGDDGWHCNKNSETEGYVKCFITKEEAEAFAKTLKPKPQSVSVVEDKPRFKVGDYITNTKEGWKNHIGRIIEFDEPSCYYYWGFTTSGNYTDKSSCLITLSDRLATKEEIEEFLIRVAKLKYPVGCRVDSLGGALDQPVESHSFYMGYSNHLRHTGNCLLYDGELDKWATILPELKEVKFPFGNLTFTINKGSSYLTSYATCEQGNIYKKDVQAVVDWFDKDFELLGHKMRIVNEGKWFIKFGCCEGTLAEAKAILKAFD